MPPSDEGDLDQIYRSGVARISKIESKRSWGTNVGGLMTIKLSNGGTRAVV